MSIENPMDVQIGGGHYKSMAIQPMEYSMANKLDACQHTAIKYITRFREKGGIQDLEKAKHVIDMLIHFEQRGAEVDIGVAAADAGQMKPLAEVVAAYAPIDPADVDSSGEVEPGKPAPDPYDWYTWKPGDLLVCEQRYSEGRRELAINVGDFVRVLKVEDRDCVDDLPVKVNHDVLGDIWPDHEDYDAKGYDKPLRRIFRFHSRPTK